MKLSVGKLERSSRETWGQAGEGLDNKHERNNEWPENMQRARKRAIQTASRSDELGSERYKKQRSERSERYKEQRSALKKSRYSRYLKNLFIS